jgi:hypothetical protein
MEPRLRRGYRGLLGAFVALLVVFMAVGCSSLGQTGTTAGGVTTTGGATTIPPGDTTTTTPGVTTTTLAPVTTLPPGTTLPPAATTTSVSLSSAEELLPGGHIKAMGFIDSVWMEGSTRKLSIDYAEMITDHDAATAAARAAGDIGPTEEWDLDFYISNVNPLLRTFVVSDSVAITTATRWPPHDGMTAPCPWTDFYNFWNLIGPPVEGDSQMPHVPWWIERDGGTIVKISEQYLP